MLSKHTTIELYPYMSNVCEANTVPIPAARTLTLGRWATAVGHSDWHTRGTYSVP